MAHAEVYEDSTGKFRWRAVDWVAPTEWDIPLESADSFNTPEEARDACNLPLTIIVKPALGGHNLADALAQARANNDRRKRPPC